MGTACTEEDAPRALEEVVIRRGPNPGCCDLMRNDLRCKRPKWTRIVEVEGRKVIYDVVANLLVFYLDELRPGGEYTCRLEPPYKPSPELLTELIQQIERGEVLPRE